MQRLHVAPKSPIVVRRSAAAQNLKIAAEKRQKPRNPLAAPRNPIVVKDNAAAPIRRPAAKRERRPRKRLAALRR